MDVGWTSLMRCLPPSVAACLATVSAELREATQEVRLRVGAPLTLSTTTAEHPLAIVITQALLAECFLRLCDHAVHTHQEELAQGFVTAQGGLRVGVAGTAVIRDGRVMSYRALTSLCIRMPRLVYGCASPLVPYLTNGGFCGMLIGGAPSAGKTTLLRDLARQLGARHRVCVVDERAELSAEELSRCDVLRGCPKTTGMLQAVRTLAPDFLIVDELGAETEWHAVTQSLFCGVAVIASAHITSPRDLLCRPCARHVLESGGFSWVLQLPPRGRVREAAELRKAGDYVEGNGDPVDRLFLRGTRADGGASLAAM